jgi:hypothetical protein
MAWRHNQHKIMEQLIVFVFYKLCYKINRIFSYDDVFEFVVFFFERVCEFVVELQWGEESNGPCALIP